MPKPARVAQMLALAHDLRKKLDCRECKDQTALGRDLGMTPTKVTWLLDLLLLAPDIQEEILFLEATRRRGPVTERALREVVRHPNWADQRRVWSELIASH